MSLITDICQCDVKHKYYDYTDKYNKLWKESLHTDRQNKQSPLTFTHWTQIKITTYNIGNPVSIEGIDILYH